MPGPVALTGATGFIGNALLDRLAEDGWRIRALTRRPRPPREPVRWIQGDLEDSAALRELVEGAAAVIHCAGVVRGSSLAAFTRTNTRGTANLVAAARSLPAPPRFLLISSLAAREPQLSWYAASKRQAEAALAAAAGEMPWTVFRPTAVYGPGDRELAPLLRTTRRGFLPMPGRTSARFSLLHVDDLVAAVVSWLGTEPPPRGVFELDDGTPGGYDRDSLARIAGEIWGRPVRPLPVPAALLSAAAFINLGLARLCRYAPMLTPGKVRELTHPDWMCDNTSLMRVLPDWRPRVSLREAFRAAALPVDKK